jgi:hypothetical protein
MQAAGSGGDLFEEVGRRPSRRYNRFSAAAYEEGISRIYCGIHFRTAMKIGFWQGGRIARYVDDNVLRPVSD